MLLTGRMYWPSSPLVLDHHVLALDVAGFVQALAVRSGSPEMCDRLTSAVAFTLSDGTRAGR
jgi:hypothetical protein